MITAMAQFRSTVGKKSYSFVSLKELLAKASPARSGDALAGIAAENDEQRVAAQMALADVPLRRLLDEPIVPYESDEVTRLIVDGHRFKLRAMVRRLSPWAYRILSSSRSAKLMR